MNGKSAPLTEADIIAARYRAAEGGVPWDREKAIRDAVAKGRAATRRRRRNRLMLAGASLLVLILAALVWYLTRSH